MRRQQPSMARAQRIQDAQTILGGTRTAFPTGTTRRFGLGLWGTPAQSEVFYFIPCFKKGCSAGRWVAVVVKGCARNKVG